MQPKRQVRTENRPSTRDTEKLETLLQEVATDARERSERYLRETAVPEGGE